MFILLKYYVARKLKGCKILNRTFLQDDIVIHIPLIMLPFYCRMP